MAYDSISQSKDYAAPKDRRAPSATEARFARRNRIERLERMANFLDSRFRIPLVNIPVGWDSILGLIPGVGALVTFLPSVAMIYEAGQCGVSRRTRWRMAGNTLIDMALGAVPVVGDIADVFFKSHRRNIKLLKSEYERIEAKSA